MLYFGKDNIYPIVHYNVPETKDIITLNALVFKSQTFAIFNTFYKMDLNCVLVDLKVPEEIISNVFNRFILLWGNISSASNNIIRSNLERNCPHQSVTVFMA